MEKRFVCKSGANDEVVTEVTLNGVLETERLTPTLAARAARVAFGHRSGATVTSNDNHGYRLYANSARRFRVGGCKMTVRDRRIIDRANMSPYDEQRGYVVDLSEGNEANPDCYWPVRTLKEARAFLALVDGGVSAREAHSKVRGY